ncbi:MAG TPA: SUMF1/EgtB/PvdO family nonheme iron enzyme, partial [Roseimicrobium sp.]|nr:SUMF1/EgtB/PvdO family nonheme iron enzyme [Roseimicrobium sp.]
MRAAQPWIWGVVGVMAFGYLMYFLTTLGPRRVGKESAEVKMAPNDPKIAQLSAEIDDLLKQYKQAADARMVTEDSIKKLAAALAKQRELLRIYPNAGLDQSTRLTQLDTELGNAQAKQQMEEIDRLEKDGTDAMQAANPDLATAKFSDALKLQRQINSSSASSRYKNYVRETSLAQQLVRLQAAPVERAMKEAILSARKAAAEKRWADALGEYTKARDLQDRINREFGRTVFSDLSLVDNLDSEIESLNAAGIAAEIDAKEKAGDQALLDGTPLAAAVLYSTAGTLQMQVNQKFTKSRFVSSPRVESLEIKRQTALSTSSAAVVASLDQDIAGHLRKRQIILADQKIDEAMALMDKLFATYPKSQKLDGALKIKLAYLALRRPDLRTLQDGIYDRLLPMPGASDRFLFKTEVSQALYVLVMNTNPSRNPGREFPVDSVDWNDAREFCTRLGWMIGMPARLPTMDEYRVALGDGQSVTWSQANSDDHSKEVGKGTPNRTGFYYLLGNLAEWTSTETADEKIQVFGGSYLDKPEALSKIISE